MRFEISDPHQNMFENKVEFFNLFEWDVYQQSPAKEKNEILTTYFKDLIERYNRDMLDMIDDGEDRSIDTKYAIEPIFIRKEQYLNNLIYSIQQIKSKNYYHTLKQKSRTIRKIKTLRDNIYWWNSSTSPESYDDDPSEGGLKKGFKHAASWLANRRISKFEKQIEELEDKSEISSISRALDKLKYQIPTYTPLQRISSVNNSTQPSAIFRLDKDITSAFEQAQSTAREALKIFEKVKVLQNYSVADISKLKNERDSHLTTRDALLEESNTVGSYNFKKREALEKEAGIVSELNKAIELLETSQPTDIQLSDLQRSLIELKGELNLSINDLNSLLAQGKQSYKNVIFVDDEKMSELLQAQELLNQ